MSIKIFTSTTDSRLILFLLISFAIHIGILFIAPQAKNNKKMLPKLIPVDVIEIPKPKEPEVRTWKPEEKKKMPDAFLPPKESARPNVSPPMEEIAKPQSKILPPEEKIKEETLPKEELIEKKEEKPLTLFPTKERISELSKEYEKTTPVGEKGRDISFDTNEPRFTTYFEGLKAKIYREWEYPDAAVREGLAGRLWVRFVIKKDGALEEVTLIRGSGYPMLDDAALSAIRLAAPFYPFPKTFGSLERITINASFEYLLENLPPKIRHGH